MLLLPSRFTISKLLLICVLALCSNFSHAGLMGQKISAEVGVNLSGRGPFGVDYYTSIGPSYATVEEGKEFSEVFIGSVDFSDTTFHATFNSAHPPFGFNGFVYRLMNPGSLQFLNVTLMDSNLLGFDGSRVYFNKNTIAIDMGGLSAAGHFIDLAIETGAVVSEPSIIALLGFGLAGLAASRSRKAAYTRRSM